MALTNWFTNNLLEQLLWTFSIILESVCVLPQLLLLRQTSVPTVLDSYYLVTLGSYRFLYILKRRRKPGVRPRDLPPIDAVLLTHAHMDHLNLPSLRRIVRLAGRQRRAAPVVFVPRGVEDLVAKIGFSQVIPMEWWQSEQFGPLTITMTPAQHWGARLFADTHRGYGGYTIASGEHTVYHSGDTAYFNGFHEIGRRLKPTVALLPIGAYFPDSFRSVHTSPEEALQAFLDLKQGNLHAQPQTMIPMHYGTFRLSLEPMEEPVPRLLAAAEKDGVAEQMLSLVEGRTYLFPQASGSIAAKPVPVDPALHAHWREPELGSA